MAPPKLPSLDGFTAISEQILVREGSPSTTTFPPGSAPSPQHPGTIVIYGWGDGLPKHVGKFADGFRAIYPHARQIVVISPMGRALFDTLQKRAEYMRPVIDAIWPDGAPDAKDAGYGAVKGTKTGGGSPVLIHTMSNTGAIFYCATLYAYRQLYTKPMPHELFVMDSTPGSVVFSWDTLKRWSRAMALGPAKMVPLPFVAVQSVFAVVISVGYLAMWAIGQESAGAWSRKAVKNTDYEVKTARKLYLYSKEDMLINYKDIEPHVEESRALGWEADTCVFEGSDHVQHMRKNPERYWKAIMDAWDLAIGRK